MLHYLLVPQTLEESILAMTTPGGRKWNFSSRYAAEKKMNNWEKFELSVFLGVDFEMYIKFGGHSMMTDELEPKCKKNLHRFGNVYLLVCHVQFLAQGAGFCLQFPNVQDKRALYKGAASRNFVLGSPLHLERETAHDRRTNRQTLSETD